MQIQCFHLWDHGSTTVKMPRGARLLNVQLRDDAPILWALADEDAPAVPRRVYSVETGHRANHVEMLPYIGTTQRRDGLVIHFFDGGEA